MCLLIVQRDADGSLWLAANRDEHYARPSLAPHAWDTQPAVLAGRDQVAGGTWLAVSELGVVAAITNRRSADADDPRHPDGPPAPRDRPTRGRLPLLACAQPTARLARQALADHLRTQRYHGFNLLVADARSACIIQCPGPVPDVQPVEPGLHVMANTGWDDPADPRVSRARALLADLPADPAGRLAALQGACRDGGTGPADALCIHGVQGGTVSSTILQLDPAGRLVLYLHAPGPPDQAPYAPVAVPWA